MSESRYMTTIRGRPRVKDVKPAKTGLECPVCGNHTVNRDIAPDGFYVEYCSGGTLTITLPFAEDKDSEKAIEFITNEFECPYWDEGFDEDILRRKRRRLFEASEKAVRRMRD